MSAARKLKDLGITLPKAAAPVANYVPWVICGPTLYISGQLPLNNGELTCTGQVGAVIDVPRAAAAARQCGINLIAQMHAALGDLDRVNRVIKLGAFIASADGFFDQPKVANGCSDLMVEVFGDAGRHARSAVGVPVLPLNASVEIDAIVAIS